MTSIFHNFGHKFRIYTSPFHNFGTKKKENPFAQTVLMAGNLPLGLCKETVKESMTSGCFIYCLWPSESYHNWICHANRILTEIPWNIYDLLFLHYDIMHGYSVYGPSQWQTTLHCNVNSHWLGAHTKWSLMMWKKFMQYNLISSLLFSQISPEAYYRADSRLALSQWEMSLQATPSLIGWAQT